MGHIFLNWMLQVALYLSLEVQGSCTERIGSDTFQDLTDYCLLFPPKLKEELNDDHHKKHTA